jgi:hypothetical protein
MHPCCQHRAGLTLHANCKPGFMLLLLLLLLLLFMAWLQGVPVRWCE